MESFVARVWLEYGQNGEPIWRGHVRHVQSSREAYFQDLREMSKFLEQVSGVPGPLTERTTEARRDGDPPSQRRRR